MVNEFRNLAITLELLAVKYVAYDMHLSQLNYRVTQLSILVVSVLTSEFRFIPFNTRKPKFLLKLVFMITRAGRKHIFYGEFYC